MMIDTHSGPQAALKFETEVDNDGRLELQVPTFAGERVVVFVIPEPAESFQDLTATAQSSLERSPSLTLRVTSPDAAQFAKIREEKPRLRR